MLPTFSLPPRFLGGCASDPGTATFCIAGIPFDLGVTNRSGAREGPQAVRRASRMLADGANPAGWSDPAQMSIADLGDFSLALGDIPRSLEMIEQQAAGIGHLLAVGGDHTITLALLRALVKRTGPVGLVHFDAHIDTWPDNFGQKLAHGSPFFHALREGLVDPRRMIQIGIRSPMPREVYDWTVGQGVTIVTAEQVHAQGPQWVAEAIGRVVGEGLTYLSFDIDAIDPGQAPGTGTPEVGGLFTWQVMAILRRLAGLRFVGMDVVEVAPAYDVSEITALAAASILWQYLTLRPLDKL
ncbi:agmatinase [Paramagnetospirillum magneticum]|uniref:Arginase/agmatinase/formimionoglutamate hydrolase n=1 Tax=Paramagnetospirillum magneticum (strain ATCC 700264 / AMB-1) TaxID=342108 RepID=Q2W8C1_PARM1|nr:agmatinase [Paramagnetospirillum magneticum]BAE49904.1 Arginase/agmatinase/formimionoglutamate hydrolase [Paramagnetospirillum magneticum AMB-1]